jgi:chemotaxis signal transduction protein
MSRAAAAEDVGLDVLLLEGHEALLAVPLHSVVQVVPRVQLLRLPGSPVTLAGHLRFRGEHVPVIDLAARLGREPLPVRLEDRIVLLEEAGARHGLLVPEVAGVARLHRSETSLLTGLAAGIDCAVALASREGRSVVLVSVERLLAAAC